MKALAALVASTLSLTSSGIGAAGSSPRVTTEPIASLGTFAGYQAFESVKSVSAEWQAPTFAARSPDGLASTWIGAQDSGTAFIQIGVTEVRSNQRNYYAAFWSDTHVNFHPQVLAHTVRAGDVIVATMTATSNRWLLHISDRTEDWADSLVNTTTPTRGVNQAEWFQEDPTGSTTSAGLPYPTLSDIDFSHVKLNAKAPTLSLATASWMSENGRVLAPGPFTSDQFILREIHLDSGQIQFLVDVRALNVAAATAGYKERPGSVYIDALSRFISALDSQVWPSRARSAVLALAKTNGLYLTQLRLLAAAEPRPTKNLVASELKAGKVALAADERARLSLGLPPTVFVNAAEAKA
jgi:hypothetical protein